MWKTFYYNKEFLPKLLEGIVLSIYDLVTEDENIRNHEIVDNFVENSLPEPGLSCTILFKTGGKSHYLRDRQT